MISAASVVTKKSLSEFLLLKMSLEQYHDVQWYCSVDEHSESLLKSHNNIHTIKSVKTDDCSHGINDPIKNRLHLELMMTKFDAVKAAIKDNGYGLFIDADIFFTSPIEDRVISMLENKDVDVVLSPHMTNNLSLEAQVGHFNGGLYSARNMDFVKIHEEMSWRHKELGMYYEQQPMQFAGYNFLTVNLPINYNIGWWRFNETFTKKRLDLLTTDGRQLLFDGKKAVCFHVHTLKSLDYTNYGQFMLDKIISLMKKTDNVNYEKILDYLVSSSSNLTTT